MQSLQSKLSRRHRTAVSSCAHRTAASSCAHRIALSSCAHRTALSSCAHKTALSSCAHRTALSSCAHRTGSVSEMDHELFAGMTSTVLDWRQWNFFVCKVVHYATVLCSTVYALQTCTVQCAMRMSRKKTFSTVCLMECGHYSVDHITLHAVWHIPDQSCLHILVCAMTTIKYKT